MSEHEAEYTSAQPEDEQEAPPAQERSRKKEEAFNPPAEPQYATVRVIDRNEHTALVEWLDTEKLVRHYVPNEAVSSGQVTYEDLAIATPYGTPWEEEIQPVSLTPEQIAEALRARGIWTFEDMALDRRRAETAVLSIVRNNISQWIRSAKEAMRNG